MKELFDIIAAKQEGFTRREWMIGGAVTAAMVLIAILANF